MALDGIMEMLPERELEVVVGVCTKVCWVPFTGDVVAESWLSDPFTVVLAPLVAVALVAAAPAPLDVAAAVAGAKVPVVPSALE